MKQLLCYGDNINQRNIDEVVEALRHGDVIIYPTDTLYALGCDALNSKAIERLCRLKDINPQRQTLSIICASLSQAAEFARIDNRAFHLMKEYQPGPFTFILPAASTLPKVFKGRKTVGVRIPDSAVARHIAETLGNPVLTTSAVATDDEISADGMVDPSALALKYEHDAVLILDAGEGGLGKSTIIDCTDSSDPQIIRQGIGEIDL